MKSAPTLIDAVYRHTFQRETQFGWRSNVAMRKALTDARRFVLDEKMSGFLADLANASFTNPRSARLQYAAAEQLRISARSPHRSVWVEYDMHAYENRRKQLGISRSVTPGMRDVEADLSEIPMREGWLIRQHPTIETAFDLHIFSADNKKDRSGFAMWTFPVAYAWATDDGPLPWRPLVNPGEGDRMSSSAYLGLGGYASDNVAIIKSDLLIDPETAGLKFKAATRNLIYEWIGIMRRVWALLATINDLPMEARDVRASKGFVARGSYRKFLDHRMITLAIPARADPMKVARGIVATVRRRAHQVRGHWRRDWRNPGSVRCEHRWNTENRCELCSGHRLWIHEHQRGDASAGFVTHDYSVTHPSN
jgi:hypothetical protein